MLGAAIIWSFTCCLRWLLVICFYPSLSWRVTDNACQPTLLHLHLRQRTRKRCWGRGWENSARAGSYPHVEAVCEADWPAWTEMGHSNRKTVCFQWVLVTWGPVENITWHTKKNTLKLKKKKKEVKILLIKTAVIADILKGNSLQVLDY